MEGLPRRPRPRERKDPQPRDETIPLLRRADARREAGPNPSRRHRDGPRHGSERVEGHRHARPQGRRPRLRDRGASLPLRHDPPRHAARQGAAPGRLRGDARLAGWCEGRRDAGSQSRARRRVRRSRRTGSRRRRARPRRADVLRKVEGDPRPALEPDHLRVPQKERGDRRARRAPYRRRRRAGYDLRRREALSHLHRRVHRPCPARAARRRCRMERRQFDRLDRHPAPVRRPRGARRGVRPPVREHPRDHARHRLRLRRQAQRRRRD